MFSFTQKRYFLALESKTEGSVLLSEIHILTKERKAE